MGALAKLSIKKNTQKQKKSNQEHYDLDALEYHEFPKPGKLEIVATKPLANQRDLSLAYSPGVADACRAIAENPADAARYTTRANLVGVISNGTAVLGLGDIGPLASKPVMEGKAVLFKKFSGVDVFDIEVNEKDPQKLIEIIAGLEPTFGGINLEDIKAPECFIVEEALEKRLNIPVFHDDQHGTAIIVSAAVINGLKLVGKNIANVKVVTSGAGAAALACLKMLTSMGVKKENITVTDIHGVVYEGRQEEMDPYKTHYAQKTDARTLAEVMDGADIFLGLSAGGVLKPEMVKNMAEYPLILALANPTPEITPEEARAVRPDAILATGRSDYPNQVNNVLCFPYIFRGALDVGATCINDEMKKACVYAIASLVEMEASEKGSQAYGMKGASFGPDYIIPTPFDHRLILAVAPAVARAAMESGVATRPIQDLEAYRQSLNGFVFQSGMLMKPIFDRARQAPKRVVFAEGENKRVLAALQMVLDEGLAKPIVIGRKSLILQRIEEMGMRYDGEQDIEIVDPQNDPRYDAYWGLYHELMQRHGVTPVIARKIVRSDTSVIASLMVRRGEADAMLCGTFGSFEAHLNPVKDIIGYEADEQFMTSLNVLVAPTGTLFIADTEVNNDPSVDDLVKSTLLVVDEVRQFGVEPRVAFVSRSNFGSHELPCTQKMAQAVEILKRTCPDLMVEGEMQPELAFDEGIRERLFPNSRLTGQANVLMMPSGDAANIAFGLAKSLERGVGIGPILLGAAAPVHIVTPSTSARGILNMTAVAVAGAQRYEENRKSL